MSGSWKRNVNSAVMKVMRTWTWWGLSCSQPGEGGAQRWRAVACRQTEVTEGPPRVRPATLKTRPECNRLPGNTEGLWGNGFRSTDHTFGMNEALAVVNSVKISRAFAAEYLAFHALIFFFDSLWIIMICQDRKTSRPPTALFIFLTFGTLRPQNWVFKVFKEVWVLWSPDSCRILSQFPLTVDY